jgi:hypothetical protein
MSEVPLPQNATASDSATRSLLHLLGLNAFAFTQPILDRLKSNPQYLILEDYSAEAVLSTVAMLLFVPPLILWAAIRGLRQLGHVRLGDSLMKCSLALYGVLSLLVLTRWIASSLNLMERGIPETLLAVVAASVGLLLPRFRARSELFRQGLSLLAIGVVIFPASLLTSKPIRQHVLQIHATSPQPQATLQNPVPIVMLILDGLSGMSLLNAQHEIDGQRFPGFARLASISHFYRNATTVHTRTDHAVPAILTSTIPEEAQTPVEADYPENLFRTIFESQQYDLSVFEPVTRMCPDELRQIDHQRGLAEQIRRLLGTTLTVYLQGVIPREMPGLSSRIPREWFGLIPPTIGGRKSLKGQIIYSWDEHRDVQFQHFLECLTPGTRPGFRFLHIALPHYPWSILPSGKPCLPGARITQPTYGLLQEMWTTDPWPVHQAWQRNLLQLQYADRCINRLLDTLQSHGQLDQSLLVVTADHGMSFVPGASLREATDQTLPDILPIPLFIKLPGQSQGTISDRNVETIDILPTIADVVGMPVSSEWQGSSLLKDTSRPRKTVRGSLNTVLEPDFPSRFRHVERLIAVFGNGGPEDQIGRMNQRPELVGRQVSEFPQEASLLTAHVTETHVQSLVQISPEQPETNYVPSLIHGYLHGTKTSDGPVEVAIAVQGRIVVTTRTSTDPQVGQCWSALIPETDLPAMPTPLELYEIDGPAGHCTLRKIPLPPQAVPELRDLLEANNDP